jgi:hypothetical protein
LSPLPAPYFFVFSAAAAQAMASLRFMLS